MNQRHTRSSAKLPNPSPVRRKHLRLTLLFLLVAFALASYHFLSTPPTVEAISATVVISQVYGGSGCGTANCSTYKNDFIELYNRGTTAVSLNGWSVQYDSASSTSGNFTVIASLPNFTLQPGQYFLIQAGGTPANGINSLPTPDATGGTNMAATAGKVALVNSTTALTTGPSGCPTSFANVVDFVGYGSANCSETSPAPAPSTTTADIRKGIGGNTQDTDNNLADFTAATPNPRNSSTFSNPISFDSAGQGCNFFTVTSSSTFSWNHTIGGGINRVLIVGVSTSYEVLPLGLPTDRVLSVTYNGQQMTRLGTIVNGTDARVAVEMFRLKEVETSPAATLPAAGTYPVVVNLITPLTPDYAVGGSASFSAVNQTTPNGTFQSASGNSTNPTVAVPSAGNQIVIDTVGTTFNGGTLLVGAGQTERWNGVPCFNGVSSVGAGSTEPGATTTTMSWTESAAQPWAIGAVSLQPVAPTAVELANFDATQTSRGVMLRWETGYEVDNLGFNIYREQGGKRTRVNPSVIAGSALLAGPKTRLTAGLSYAWLDRSAKRGDAARYWLEDIDLDGTHQLHGPITPAATDSSKTSGVEESSLLSDLSRLQPASPSVTGYPAVEKRFDTTQQQAADTQTEASPAPRVQRRSLLSRLLRLPDASVDTTTSEAATTGVRSNLIQYDPLAQQRALAAGKAIKISIRQAGWYRVTQPELVAAGLGQTIDPGLLQLYADGVEQPIIVRGGNQSQFGADASIEFYGAGLDTQTSDTRTYWLVVGSQPGRRINAQGNQIKDEVWVDNVANAPTAKPQNNTQPGAINKPIGATIAPSLMTNPAIIARPWLILSKPSTGISSATPKSRKKALRKASRRKLQRKQHHASVKRNHAEMKDASSPQGFAYTWERKDRVFYFAALLNGEADNFFGPLILKTPVKQDLELTNIDPSATGPATLEVALQGLTVQPHEVRVMLNGADVGLMSFNGQEHPVKQFSIPRTSLLDGNNSITLVSLNGDSDINLVDYVRLTYWRAFHAANDTLTFTSRQTTPILVDGFNSPQIRVFDVTDRNAVEQVGAKVLTQGAGYAIKVAGGKGSTRTLLALADSRMQHPSSITANEPSAWSRSDNRADFVIITHRDFRDAVKPLADLRKSQGLETVIVDVEDIYDEFSLGAHSREAIKDFLALAKSSWALAPRYALFVGDASIDPRNYLGFGNQDFVPTKLVDTFYLETASDDSLCDFDGDGVADLAIGRLPVRTIEQAQKMVAKIANYAPGQPANAALLISDRLDGYDFEAANNQVRNLLPESLSVTAVNRRDNSAEQVRSEIINGINVGPLLVNYAGHGSSDVWTGAGILRSTDAASLSNSNRLPLFVLMTCLNGRFQDPPRESLAEALMKAEGGGAVAVWASSGLTEPDPQALMNQQLMRLLFNGNQSQTLGDAVRGAKAATANMDARRTWILFGDPTMRIR
jgi:hypothetical protein